MAKKIPLFYDSLRIHSTSKDDVCYPHHVHEFMDVFATTDINRSLPSSEKFYFLLDRDFLIAFWDIAYYSKRHVPADLWTRAWGFFKRIPVDIVAQVKNKQAKFLLHDIDWSMCHAESEFARFVEIMAHSIGVVYSDFVFTSNIYQTKHSKLQLASYNFWEIQYVSRFMHVHPDIGQDQVKVINNKRVKNNKFICLINRKSVTRMLTAIPVSYTHLTLPTSP
jgi:hypothetical protein